LSGYREFKFWSAELDSKAARLSMSDDKGQEYFAIVECGKGKSWRERREWALQCIDDAIAMGWPPGLVGIRAMPEPAFQFAGEDA
jgi:hypothetical protein